MSDRIDNNAKPISELGRESTYLAGEMYATARFALDKKLKETRKKVADLADPYNKAVDELHILEERYEKLEAQHEKDMAELRQMDLDECDSEFLKSEAGE